MAIDFSTLIQNVNAGITGGLRGQRAGQDDVEEARRRAILNQFTEMQVEQMREAGERQRQEDIRRQQEEKLRASQAEAFAAAQRQLLPPDLDLPDLSGLSPQDRVKFLEDVLDRQQELADAAARREAEGDASAKAFDRAVKLKRIPQARAPSVAQPSNRLDPALDAINDEVNRRLAAATRSAEEGTADRMLREAQGAPPPATPDRNAIFASVVQEFVKGGLLPPERAAALLQESPDPDPGEGDPFPPDEVQQFVAAVAGLSDEDARATLAQHGLTPDEIAAVLGAR